LAEEENWHGDPHYVRILRSRLTTFGRFGEVRKIPTRLLAGSLWLVHPLVEALRDRRLLLEPTLGIPDLGWSGDGSERAKVTAPQATTLPRR
jgi:hypothetical protein